MKYRLSEHGLAKETGRHKTAWLPEEEFLCMQCKDTVLETELHFLIFQAIRKYPDFVTPPIQSKLPYISGEDNHCCVRADPYILACHQLRDS